MSNSVSVTVKCPLCKKSLMNKENPLHDKPSIKLSIKIGGTWGSIRLCSVYGCYEHKSDLEIKDTDMVEFYCPHCMQLLNTKEECDVCHAPMVALLLDIGGKVVICSRNGCSKHYVAFEDIGSMLRKFYDEYGF